MFFGLFGKKQAETGDLKPGNEVDFEIEGDKEREIFVGEIAEADQKSVTLLLSEGNKNLKNKFNPNTEVRVNIDLDEEICSFQTVVLDFQEDPPRLFLARPKKLEKKEKTEQEKQRRNFVRIEVALDVTFYLSPGVERHATTLDVSGSGLGMVTDFSLPVGKKLEMKFELPEKEIRCKGKVVRSKSYSKLESLVGKHNVAITFANLDQRDQDAIVRFIFERQRQLRRRGLL